jgi:acetyl esterase/lipase
VKRTAGNVIAVALALIAFVAECWIVVPPPDIAALVLGIAIPELGAWTILFWLAGFTIATSIARGAARMVAQTFFALAIGFALVPFLLLPKTIAAANAAMQRALGPDWRFAASDRVRERMQDRPFSLVTAYLGANAGEPTIERNVPVPVSGGTLALDVYHPTGDGLHPALIVMYGGAWRFGARANTAEIDRTFAKLGYVAIAVDYRHAPEFRFPTQRDDITAALTVIAAHQRAWSIDPERIGILGQSAGAQLAMLAAYAPGPLRIGSVVAEYSPTDLIAGYTDPPRPDPADVRSILRAYIGGTPADHGSAYTDASPIMQARTNLPPTLMLVGNRDELVRTSFQRTMRDALAFHRDRVVAIELPWSNHAFDTIPNGIGGQLARYYIERFLAATL